MPCRFSVSFRMSVLFSIAGSAGSMGKLFGSRGYRATMSRLSIALTQWVYTFGRSERGESGKGFANHGDGKGERRR